MLALSSEAYLTLLPSLSCNTKLLMSQIHEVVCNNKTSSQLGSLPRKSLKQKTSMAGETERNREREKKEADETKHREKNR